MCVCVDGRTNLIIYAGNNFINQRFASRYVSIEHTTYHMYASDVLVNPLQCDRKEYLYTR